MSAAIQAKFTYKVWVAHAQVAGSIFNYSLIIKNGQIVDVHPASEDEYMSMEPLGFRNVSS